MGNRSAVDLTGLRVGVSGARGFIGTRLHKVLRSAGADAIALEGDVRQRSFWEGRFDVLYHLAAAMPADFDRDPVSGFNVNVEGMLRALDAASGMSARVVFASTSGVYRPASSGPLDEAAPVDPPSAYAASKRAAEVLCTAFSDHCEAPAVVLRFFNVYGPGQSDSFLIPYLTHSLATGQVADVRQPDSARDFVYVDDVVDVMVRAAEPSVPAGVVNVGSGRANSVRKVIAKLEGLSGRRLNWRHAATDLNPATSIYADCRAARRLLGWSATTSIEKGLRAVLADFSLVGADVS